MTSLAGGGLEATVGHQGGRSGRELAVEPRRARAAGPPPQPRQPLCITLATRSSVSCFHLPEAGLISSWVQREPGIALERGSVTHCSSLVTTKLLLVLFVFVFFLISGRQIVLRTGTSNGWGEGTCDPSRKGE